MTKIISQDQMKLKFIQDITDGTLDTIHLLRYEQRENSFKATLQLVQQICHASDVVPLFGIVQKTWVGENSIIIKDSPSLNSEIKAILSEKNRKDI